MKKHRSHSNGTRRWERSAGYKEKLEARTEKLRREIQVAHLEAYMQAFLGMENEFIPAFEQATVEDWLLRAEVG